MRRLISLIVCSLLVLPGLKAQQHHSDALDDLLQHVPMASVFALKAIDYWADEAEWEALGNHSSWIELTATAVASYVVSAGVAYGMKQTVRERRPDGSDRRSFPSGHATFAFAGATMLRHEFGHVSPWVTVGGYGLAALVAVNRVRLDRHYLHDVCAGAAIGIGATELSYYLGRRLWPDRPVVLSATGQTITLTVTF